MLTELIQRDNFIFFYKISEDSPEKLYIYQDEKTGFCFLHSACLNGKIEHVTYYMESICNLYPNSEILKNILILDDFLGSFILHFACKSKENSKNIVELLLQYRTFRTFNQEILIS